MLKGAFITNRYYSDSGTEYAFASLKRAFAAYSNPKIDFFAATPCAAYDKSVHFTPKDFDFAVFWDKDITLASLIEKSGIRVFNSSKAIAISDDKQKTYAAVSGVEIPLTVSAPLCYDVNNPCDTEFLDFVARTLGYPVVVKANTGSQGRQVFLADNAEKLRELYLKMRHIPHHYQRLTGEFGSDIRVYTVGGKAVASCKRQGTDFKSNLASGGSVSLFSPSKAYILAAEDIANQLGLDFGAVDFLSGDRPIFLEVNSNAYFTGIERLGVSIADKIAAHIKKEMEKST